MSANGNDSRSDVSSAPSAVDIEQAHRDALRLKMTRRKLGTAGRIGQAFLESKLTPLIIVASLLLGLFAIIVTPAPTLTRRPSGSTPRSNRHSTACRRA